MPVFQMLRQRGSRHVRWTARLMLLVAAVLAAPEVLAQRPLTEVDRELLEARIEELEQRLADAQAPAQALRDEERRTTAEQVRRLDEKIDGRATTFTIVISIAVAAVAVFGFLLNFFGRPAIVGWIQGIVDTRTEAEVSERLGAANVDDLVRERARPIIESVMRDIEAEARAEMAAATERHEHLLQAQREALQATATPSPEQAETVAELIESQRKSNPSREDWTVLDWILDARRLSDDGRHEEALLSLDHALELDPNDPVALNNRGVALIDLGRTDEALVALDRALAIRPDVPATLTNRGMTLNNLSRYDEALAALDRALAIRPDDPAALNSRGAALNGLGHYDEALAALDRALTIRPDDPTTLTNQGTALNNLGRFDEALAAVDRSLPIRPDDPAALNNRGMALNGLGRYDEALTAFDRLTAIEPGHPSPHYQSARAWIGLGDAERAAESAERAVALSETAPDRDYRRAVSLYFKGIALRLLGRDTDPTEAELGAALTVPFQKRLSWCVIEPTASPDPDVQAFITRLSDMMRAHDAARGL